jgi:uncharacterized protein YqgQ
MFKIKDLYSIFAMYTVNPFDTIEYKAQVIDKALQDGLIDQSEHKEAQAIIEQMKLTEINA